MMDCMWDNISLEASPSLINLPNDQVRVINKKTSSNDEYIDALAAAALRPQLTTAVLACYEPIFPDLCARWMFHQISPRTSVSAVIAAFARVLPAAPQLAILAGYLLSNRSADSKLQAHPDDAFFFISAQNDVDPRMLQEEELKGLLLAFFRLLHFDYETFAGPVSPSRLQQLFGHDRADIRYLAVRLFCMRVEAADALTHNMLLKYVGNGAIQGEWEGRTISYRFLSLWEDKFAADRQAQLNDLRMGRLEKDTKAARRLIRRVDLSPWTGEVCGVLIPRVCNNASKSSTLIRTTTTAENCRSLANALRSPAPVVVIGLSGSGKTASILDIAREVGVDKTMLILHLNEQTDAKMLVGLYTTGSTPGSFKWRPGVLSIAAQEGRWVLIEDLDRAPADVVQVLLPLLSRGELMVASQGEKIRAASGFRLIATVRSNSTFSGSEQVPSFSAFGEGLWNQVRFRMPELDEFQEIIASRYPLLHAYLPAVMRVYGRVETLYRDRHTLFSQRADGRSATARDLLRFCARLDSFFRNLGLRTGTEPLPETAEMDVLAEAVDCFSGYQPSQAVRLSFMQAIGEELHISPQRVQHHSQTYTPSYRNQKDDLLIGRARMSKRKRVEGTSESRKRRHLRSFVATKQTLRLLEQVGTAIQLAEPVLLVGETGTGKTAVVQHLAETLGHRLTVLNLSQQSESGDLLGSYKPVSTRSLVIPLKEQFEMLFESTFALGKNGRYIELAGKYIAKEKWHRVLKMWEEAVSMAMKTLDPKAVPKQEAGVGPKTLPKKRKRSEAFEDDIRSRWRRFSQDLKPLQKQLSGDTKSFVFKFIEGAIVKAARDGDWVLLDEINLAPADTLESLASLLSDGSTGDRFLLLTESGGVERIQAHPNFRILGAMNPATDVGKRDLPPGLRARFSEIFVEGPDGDFDDLLLVLKTWLGQLSEKDNRMAPDIARFYISTKQLMKENRLASSANDSPHFSLRTLTRTLNYVTELAPVYGIRRAMYEAFSMSFLAHLDNASQRLLFPILDKYIVGTGRTVRSMLKQCPRLPDDGKQYVQFEHRWVLQGDFPIEPQPHYIITPSVRRNLLNLVLAISIRQFPVLLQGPTSSGKTSMITYLAKITGNKCVRINNHEHTDLQEYIGAYASDSEGQLHFQEGVLVRALREGHWIILDELNLAPTDVLEALNRLLDDNRELMIPETQEVIKPHPNFVLFATQNPPGLYGGRKILSRAFRTRFVELYFAEIPENELEAILQERTQIAPSYCTKIVSVYKELLLLRQSDRLFEHRNSFMTLRDLFRWASRKADDREEVAINGFMLIAERVRKPEEKVDVKRIIERVFKVSIDEDLLYQHIGEGQTSSVTGIVWTKAMRRLHLLVSKGLENNEPVLLVGETGCGKTSLCQSLAARSNKRIHIVNAQQNTETGDLIGAQRPLRNKSTIEEQLRQDLLAVFNTFVLRAYPEDTATETLRDVYRGLSQADRNQIPVPLREKIASNLVRSKALFEWVDGALVQAMKQGEFFLLDEISLAEDSILERLNSVLETNRTILLAEKGSVDSLVQATPGFQFLATMNPGGDFGKRELSPALRNRFTEIWVPPVTDDKDLLEIATARLTPRNVTFAQPVVHFARWFNDNFGGSSHTSVSIRDTLAWIEFMNRATYLEPRSAYMHGAALVYVDSLGANPAALISVLPHNLDQERQRCFDLLRNLVDVQASSMELETPHLYLDDSSLSIGPFSMRRTHVSSSAPQFRFDTPTTRKNLLRIVRALELQKPILLEGSPGVGKTSLVMALADTLGRPLTRINLSEQTDLIDLFGSDAPVQGAEVGTFAWRDGPFLQAMQKGEWVLLDELNLASQSVLEGLNSCFDHRGEVYLSELDQTFSRHPQFTIFTTQNPYSQGAGRKGLPASFVNRFSVVYVDSYEEEDLLSICKGLFPNYNASDLQRLLDFVNVLHEKVVRRRQFGSHGGPWDFNLRDVTRWLQLLSSNMPLLSAGNAADFLSLIISQRFRTNDDRRMVASLSLEYLGKPKLSSYVFQDLGFTYFQAGLGLLPRSIRSQPVRCPALEGIRFEPSVVQSVTLSVQMNWPCILVGPAESGKGRLVEHLASVAGADLVEITLDSNTDTMDFVGGYEQMDVWRQARQLTVDLLDLLLDHARQAATAVLPDELLAAIEHLQSPMDSETQLQRTQNDLLLLNSKWPSATLSKYIERCAEYIQLASHPEQARFEWVDGILIKALQRGAWVILRQANLCTPSVLDRLNSLLEPDGCLIVSEKQDSQGGTPVIKPHPNFRVFLTMDPRHGEMSRAMRNRSVEIYMAQPAQSTGPEVLRRSTSSTYDYCASQYRPLTALCNGNGSNAQFASQLEAAMRRLSVSDLDYLDMWSSEVASGLSTFNEETRTAFHAVLDKIKRFRALSGDLASLPVNLNILEGILPDGFMAGQPTDPLANEPLLSFASSRGVELHILWEAFVQDVILETLSMESKLDMPTGPGFTKEQSIKRQIASFQGSAWTSSERGQPDTLMLSFLRATYQDIQLWAVAARSGPPHDRLHKAHIGDLIACWHESFEAASSSGFDTASFLTHVQLWQTVSPKPINSSDSVSTLLQTIAVQSVNLGSAWQLTTGLSMERLWSAFRPVRPLKAPNFEAFLQLERLAQRVDQLIWNIRQPLAEIVGLIESVCKAFRRLLLEDGEWEGPLKRLEEAVQGLERRSDRFFAWATPYFRTEFETLCQHHDLIGFESSQNLSTTQHFLDPLAVLFAQRATSRLETSTYLADNGQSLSERQNPAALLSQLKAYTAFTKDQSDRILAFQGCFPFTVLSKIRTAENMSLKKLDLLRWETNCLVRCVGRNTDLLSRNQLSVVRTHLMRLLKVVFNAHSDTCIQENLTWIQDWITVDEGVGRRDDKGITSFSHVTLKVPNSHHFQSIAHRYFVPALEILRGNQRDDINVGDLARAWTLFGLGCLLLYVPNLSFDPSMRTRLETNMHGHRREALSSKLQASREVERISTGQSTNWRCEIMEEDLKGLGRVDDKQIVFRPEISQLDELQAEFNTLLNSVIVPCQDSEFIQGLLSANRNTPRNLNTLRANIEQIVYRLSNKYRSYDDVIVPLQGFLSCLDFGLSLAGLGSSPPTDSVSNGNSVTPSAVFLGPRPQSLVAILPQNVDELEHTQLDVRFDCLHEFAILAKVENLESLCQQEQRTLLSIFHSIYRDWKRRVEMDQKSHTEKSGLYRFRGTDELADDEEELKELFPTDEVLGETGQKTTVSGGQAQRLTLELANLHSAIFEGTDQPADQMLRLVEERAKKHSERDRLPGALLSTHSTAEDLLPGLVVSVYGLKNSVSATTVDPNHYDFYRDPNLGELSKLLDLVRAIHQRFCEIHALWPEHATLHDVKTACEEISVVRHTEALGRLLGKLEKLHRHMHEWQLVASKELSVGTLYGEVTSTIIGWRRLELRTWARLFELEEQRCEEQAKAWWFMAYEMIIALPMSTDATAERPESHVKNLTSLLETFASTTTVGQFLPRLQILGHLKGHAALAAKHFGHMEGVHEALSNFLNYYSSFKTEVEKALKEGKQTLSKQMKEVILLASWKDTNIDALRESARRSHHKLLGVVRRYRELLGRPVSEHLKMSQPKVMVTMPFRPTKFLSPLPNIEPEAVNLCISSLPGWLERPRPWAKAGTSYENGPSLGKALDSGDEASRLLEDFSSRLTLSMKELQKETPSTQTEDNKETLALLKRRKRKLFAETLRDLRRMGFQYNLSTDVLAAQDSLSTVLGRIKPFNKATRPEEVDVIDEYFHQILNQMKVARQSIGKHSEDLTKAEVTRSTGYLEGIFLTILKQREVLVAALRQSTALATVCSTLESLKWRQETQLQPVGPEYDQEIKRLQRSTIWLPSVLETSIRVLNMQIEMAEIEGSSVLEGLDAWKQRFETLSRRWKSLPDLPTGIFTTEHTEVEKETEGSLKEFRAELRQWSEQQPLFKYLLGQLLTWELSTSSEQSQYGQDSMEQSIGLERVDVEVSTICEDILTIYKKTQDVLTGERLSEQNPSWLLKYDEKVIAATKTLQGPDITDRIQAFLGRLSRLSAEQLKVASAIAATALPTLQQYRNHYDETVHLYMNLHSSTCRLAYVLAKAYNQLATEGYCAPSDSSGPQEGKVESAENGTGLGEGEGAEDISKDIADDESLPDIAQEPNQERNGKELEDEQDAVQMADEMEGEDVEKMSQADDEKDDESADDDDDDGSGKSEIDEKIDDVDNLDPSAVDEKVGDPGGEQVDKQQLADKSQGKPNKDEKTEAAAAEEANGEANNEEDMDEMSVDDEAEEVVGQEVQEQDPYTREQDTLDLPEDLDFEDKHSTRSDHEMDSGSDGGVSLSDAEAPEPMEVDGEVDDNSNVEVGSDTEENEKEGDKEDEGVVPDNKNDEEVAGDIQDLSLKDADTGLGEADDGGPSRTAGVEDNANQEQMDQTSTNPEQALAGISSSDTGNRMDSSNTDVQPSDSQRQAGQPVNQPNSQPRQFHDEAQAQAFKKLGDVLRDWQYQPRKIREASDEKVTTADEVPQQNIEGMELEHLREDDEAADTQALGAATEEQAHALDQSKILEGRDQHENGFPAEDQDQEEQQQDEVDDPMDIDQEIVRNEPQEVNEEDQQHRGPLALLSDHRPSPSDLHENPTDNQPDDTIHPDDVQLGVSPPSSSSIPHDPQSLWTSYETLTRPHSLILTEQLRLILNPTIASKMQGDFRTGKRLNIKRIIPYIASQYRRDKIWMRRSKPGKRAYQIMISVDDSKSMSDNDNNGAGAGAGSGAGDLALQTLVMISRSLSILESGQLCILAFGECVKIAHGFENPFSSEVGPRVLDHFGFKQTKTDVKLLLSHSMKLFREARVGGQLGGGSGGTSDPWQLQLIISDGICEDHEEIKRLVRQATMERIMIIFVIVDHVGSGLKGPNEGLKGLEGSEGGLKGPKEKENRNGIGRSGSILEMSQAVFEPEESGDGHTRPMKVSMKRYLDSFPFPYYLVVGDVKSLPGVLSTALRQWFKEVVDAGY